MPAASPSAAVPPSLAIAPAPRTTSGWTGAGSSSTPRDCRGREVLLYYKPLGEVTTRSDPQGRPTVFERLPAPAAGRWISVGRLDVNTSGVLLLTTDGALAHRLMHPSGEVERVYRVRLRGRPGPHILQQLLSGVALEDGPARFDAVAPAPGAADDANHGTYQVVLHEGRNREVRRLWNAVGFEVSRLVRVRYGPIELPPEMRPGTSRAITGELLERLERAAGKTAPAAPVFGVGRGSAARSRGSAAAAGTGTAGVPKQITGQLCIDTPPLRNQNTRLVLRRGTQAANGSRL